MTILLMVCIKIFMIFLLDYDISGEIHIALFKICTIVKEGLVLYAVTA